MERNRFILFVHDQKISRDFYSHVLQTDPTLDVPGMTEFELSGGGVLGLMPSEGISKLIGQALPDPSAAHGIPRAEIYLLSVDAARRLERAMSAGATLLSPFKIRDWGHCAAYCLDPDGHVLALASEIDHPFVFPDSAVISTERLRLRPFCQTDAFEVQRLAGVRAIAEMTAAIPHPYEDGMAEAWIGEHGEEWRRGTACHWAVTRKNGGVLLGAVSLMDIDHESGMAEMGYWIAVDYWNKGYCSEAARGVIDWAFNTLGLNRVHAHHFARNPASGSVLRKVGMQHEGSRPQHFTRWGRREDVELYGILVTDWNSSQK